jgi:alpha-mannosidase
MRKTLFLFLLLFIVSISEAQVNMPFFGMQQLTGGYAKTIKGETLPYFSIYPDYIKTALLTRCTDGKMSIEWETEAVPDNKEPYVYYSWVAAHSTGTSSGIRKFDLFIDDQYKLTFETQPKQYPTYWTYGSNDSTRIVYEYVTRDRADDSHGIVYLRVPKKLCISGKPLRIRICGQAMNSNDWYMTFEFQYKEHVSVELMPFIEKGLCPSQPLRITVLHFGSPGTLTVNHSTIKTKFHVEQGLQTFDIPVPVAQKNQNLKIHYFLESLLAKDTILQQTPVSKRTFYLIPHSHTDIGYSHLQEDVIKIHVNNIRTAIALVEKTKNYPEGSRFKWNIESLWDVEHFLCVATEDEKTKFATAVKNGDIALTAFYANLMTGLCMPEEFDWLLEYGNKLKKDFGFTINTAMFTDIPGMVWSVVPSLAKNGVRYFSNGPNYSAGMPDLGDRIGGTLRQWGDKPFWWISPDGHDSILMWTCGHGYSDFHMLMPGMMEVRGPAKIAAYMKELDAKKYPYDMVPWRYSIVSDNGPCDSTLSDFVKKWNETYSTPRLEIANVNDFMQQFDAHYGKALPSYSGDFTPYWEDGAYSSAAEEIQTREASMQLASYIDLAKIENISIPEDLLYRAKRNILLFNEHTWGSWNSTSEPDSPFTTKQWKYKKSFADSANILVSEIKKHLFSCTKDSNVIIVYNTLPIIHSGEVTLRCPPGLSGCLIDDKGYEVFHTLRHDTLWFTASDVPGMGSRRYRWKQGACHLPNLGYINRIMIRIDSIAGSLNSFKFNGQEFVNPYPYIGLGQVVRVEGKDPREFQTTRMTSYKVTEDEVDPKKTVVQCKLKGTKAVTYTYSEFPGSTTMLISVEIDKIAERDIHSMHIAFPFRLTDPQVHMQMADTNFLIGKGQLPGSNCDFYSVQRWIAISGKEGCFTLCCPQAALFEVGSITNERPVKSGFRAWKEQPDEHPTLFVYALNNYWHTNFKADQEGKIKFDIWLRYNDKFNPASSNDLGNDVYRPLIGIWK